MVAVPHLLTYAGAAAPDSPVTRMGGVPLVPPGFEWPLCRHCGGPMQFVAQARLDDVDPAESGLLAIFLCQNDPGGCLEWEADAGGNRAYVFGPGPWHPAAVPAGDAVLLPTVSAFDLVPLPADDYEPARLRWPEQTGRPGRDVFGKLGGRPDWTQVDETPTCPVCTQRMSFVVELEEGRTRDTAANFGGGVGYGFRYRGCGTGAFLWQP